MLQFSKGALLFLLTCSFDTISARTGTDFSECLGFFYQKSPPQGIQGGEDRSICQQYKNKYRFATLYSRVFHAPLYSAYKVILPKDEKIARPDDEVWMYEPQLTDEKGEPEMKPIQDDKVDYDFQASLKDYKGSIYTKGHLAPSLHQETKEDKEATFTLTNMVPQRGGSNNGPWVEWEKEIVMIKKDCEGDMFVITGGLPFKPERKAMNEKVSVPEYMWSAYCCTAFKTDLNGGFPTHAALGRNDPNSDINIVPKDHTKYPDYAVRKLTLKDLEVILKERLNTEQVTLFKEDCKAN
ncbi:endonuclease domain-containing 1 protein [Kryptolebias marmoratus]|uniref:Endonuclease domain-containing 1 protein-like n=1 Tax=Kryptolebias marmoratus TaxID=37003 RepID=A0A3Q3FVV5_KRYMA|nr:endonuclease domain-containing 1 protein [Kryptolebias marmoratus]